MQVNGSDTTKAFENAAVLYSNEMNKYLVKNGIFPEFDWILLCIGDDGHTASLFPNTDDLDSEDFTLLVLKPNTSEYRVSFSATTIHATKRISYLVTGRSKAKVVAEIISEHGHCNIYPADLIRAESGTT